MQAFAALSMLLIGVVTFVVGVRLLLVARRTRQIPELAFGVAFISGSLGSALAQIGQRVLWKDAGALATVANAGCFGLQVVGTVLLFVAIWRIFRPDRAWAQWFCVAGSLAACASFALRLQTGELADARIETPAMLLFFATRLVLFAWAAYEPFRYHAMLKRRVALGLAEPLAAQQIFLWALSALVTFGVTATIVSTIFGLHLHPVEYAPSTAVITVLSLSLSVTMWCAFFPPAALRRRAQAASG